MATRRPYRVTYRYNSSGTKVTAQIYAVSEFDAMMQVQKKFGGQVAVISAAPL